MSKNRIPASTPHGATPGSGWTNSAATVIVNRRRSRLLHDANEILGTASLAFVLAGLLTGMVGAVSLLQSVEFGPPVGEILHFGPYVGWTPGWQIDARRASDHRHCVLKPAVMALSHGSAVVEQRQSGGRVFLIHWAGGPTGEGGGSCGETADLLLGLAAVQTLLNADAAGQHWHFVGP